MLLKKVHRGLLTFIRNSSTSRNSKHTRIIKQKYVPSCEEPSTDEVSSLQDFVDSHKKTLVITGAGLSTESGIPDYRSEDVGLYARKNYKPMQYQQFISSAALRQRYWARSYVGWPGYSKILPSDNHHILSNWERSGLIHWLITQNVDHLHVKAGSERVTELHGTLYETVCLSCKNVISRLDYQEQIEDLNPEWSVQTFEIATDGDVFLTDEQVQGFKVSYKTYINVNVVRVKYYGAATVFVVGLYVISKAKASYYFN